MSILITDSNLIDKITEVEGAAWCNDQDRALKHATGNWLDCTIHGAIKHWNTYYYGSFTIYGSGGWNRYFLRDDGRVVFSRHHTSHDGIEKATKAGFDIE